MANLEGNNPIAGNDTYDFTWFANRPSTFAANGDFGTGSPVLALQYQVGGNWETINSISSNDDFEFTSPSRDMRINYSGATSTPDVDILLGLLNQG